MRSIRTLAVTAAMLLMVSGCGDDGSGTQPGGNQAPVADFEAPSCIVNVPCSFTSTSTDDVAVTEWTWDFDGDGLPDETGATASFIYSTAGTYSVTLRVRDAEGLSHSRTRPVTASPPGSGAPVANFTADPCTASLPCQFTSTSSGAVTEWSWDFNGDGTADATTATFAYTYAAPGNFNASLTVRDAGGLSNTKTIPIAVAAPPANTPPTASFTVSCPGASCSFTSTSSDVAPGTIVSYAWTFGDGGTASVPNPLYSYAITAERQFNVTLTVTDNEGATDSETQTITVAPPVAGAEGCSLIREGIVDCAFNVPVRSTMKLKILGLSCDLRKQRVVTPDPIGDQVFLSVCIHNVGEELGIFGGPEDELIVYEAGSQVVIRFVQGIPNNGGPPLGPPSATFTGTYPDWTMNFEDGANPGQAGEPDFADVVIGLHATELP